MPLQASDIKTYKSLAADSDGQGIDVTREIISGVDNNLFPDVTAAEALSGITRYRKYFKKNTSGVDSWPSVRTFIKQQPNADTVSIGVGIDHTDDREGAQGNMTAFSATAAVAAVSDGVDARTLTILGEDAAGARQQATLVLNGTTEVTTGAVTFSKVYHVHVSAEDAARIVTIRQGAGGTTRGTIGLNFKICFLWRTGTDIDTQAEGFKQGTIAAGGNFAVWVRKVVPAARAGATGVNFIIASQGT